MAALQLHGNLLPFLKEGFLSAEPLDLEWQSPPAPGGNNVEPFVAHGDSSQHAKKRLLLCNKPASHEKMFGNTFSPTYYCMQPIFFTECNTTEST